MTDLDKAIRDRLDRLVDGIMERRNGLTSILPGTGMARVLDALTAVLDELTDWEDGASAPAVRTLRKTIASALGVSSQDTPPAPRPAGCPCATCGPATKFRVMNLCPTCSNKRCPGAADHTNTCTGSNAPGQPGSLYADVRPLSEVVVPTDADGGA